MFDKILILVGVGKAAQRICFQQAFPHCVQLLRFRFVSFKRKTLNIYTDLNTCRSEQSSSALLVAMF